MENKDIKEIIKDAANKLEDVKDQTIDAIEDVANSEQVQKIVKGTKEGLEQAGDYVQKTFKDFKAQIDENARLKELNKLAPIFPEDISQEMYEYPEVIRVIEYDKAHMESPLCERAIGWDEKNKELPVFCAYQNEIDKTNLTFYPDVDETIYYKAPCEDNKYISLEEYFKYNLDKRVEELKNLAHDLGACKVKVSTYEEKQSLIKNENKEKYSIKQGRKNAGGVEVDLSSNNSDYSFVRVDLENEFKGSETIINEPTLRYFKGDEHIESLISMRRKGTIKKEKYAISYRVKNGMKEKTAVKIDALIKGWKMNGNTTITSEVQKDNRSMFEFEIEFPQ